MARPLSNALLGVKSSVSTRQLQPFIVVAIMNYGRPFQVLIIYSQVGNGWRLRPSIGLVMLKYEALVYSTKCAVKLQTLRNIFWGDVASLVYS